MNNLDKILDAITLEADTKIAAIWEKSTDECTDAQADCVERIQELRDQNAEKLCREREMIISRAKSSADMRRREIMLNARVGLLDKAYADAEKFIYEMDRPTYSSLLAHLLCDALCDRMAEERVLAEEGEEAKELSFVVFFNKADREELGEEVIADALDLVREHGEEVPEVMLCGTPCDIKGGLILRGGDVETNCTIKALIAVERSRTEADAARVLFS